MSSTSFSYVEEFRKIIILAFPLMVTHFLRFICPFLSIMICGHFSREELDASSLANTVINVLGLCIDMGFSTASETLFSQAYGSSRRKLMGIILQRSLLIMTLIFLTLACFHISIEYFLLKAQQDPLISSLAADYIMCFLPGLYCDFLFMTLSRYLTSQNLVKPMTLAAIAGTIFTVLTQPLVYYLKLGLRASACFLSCSFATMLLCEVLYIYFYRIYSETWAGWDFVSALSDWGIFFRFGIPGVLMVAFEEWCLELSTFIAGTIGDAVLGAQAIVFQIQSFIYMVPLGVRTAVNVRVAQQLGAFDPQGARHTTVTAFVSVIGIVFSTAVPVVLMRHILPYLFTSDKEVIDEAAKLFPMLLVFQFCEGLGGVSEAVLLACGRQFLGAATIFFGYYCIGLPLGFFLTFNLEWGIIGMWVGLATGFFLTDCVYTFFALKTDWKEQSRKVRASDLVDCVHASSATFHEPEALARFPFDIYVNVCFESMLIAVAICYSFFHMRNTIYMYLFSDLLLVESTLLPYDCERVEEKQFSTTVVRPDWFKIRLKIGFFVLVSLFLLYNLFLRFHSKIPYWTTVCLNETAVKKPSAEFCQSAYFSAGLI
ncbi:unnamed protein product [Rodentolepis nana]|uniref:Multidrug and toxin extrusion protein n=1 Tax=Rodentolepis nana TaxID=102285 RepID=A0A158QHD2_RODNA|nr:unnamed protein product [Rodentolepis nana]